MSSIKSKQRTEERKKQAYEYFLSQGYSPEASAGIVGNLLHESGLDTTIEGDKGYRGGSSRGSAQWRGQRLDNLKKRYGDKWTDFNNQLEFVKYELETTHKKANEVLKNTRDVYQAGEAFSDLYEIPALKYKDNKDRQSKVNSVYSQFVGGEAPAITQSFTNYEKPADLTNFAESSPVIHTLPENEVENKEEQSKVSAAEESLKQQTNEFNFVQDFLNNEPVTRTVQQEPIGEIQQPRTPSLLNKYAEISNFVGAPVMQQGGQIPVSSRGVHDYPNQTVIVPTNGSISMKNVSYPIKATSLDTGEQKILLPEMNHFFSNTKNVLEIPLNNAR